MINGIFLDVFVEARVQPGLPGRIITGGRVCLNRFGKFTDCIIGSEKANVGGTLEKVTGQDVDGGTRPRAQVHHGFFVMLAGQLFEQHARQLVEILAHAGNVGPGTKQLAQQSQVVVRPLDFGQPFAIFVQTLHEGRQVVQGRLGTGFITSSHDSASLLGSDRRICLCKGRTKLAKA